MDIKDFNDIGIVKIYWNYDEFSSEWKEAFISIYIPQNKGYKYGEQYCIKISFLNHNDVIKNELFESSKFDLQILDESSNEVLIKMLGEKFKVNKNQLKKLNSL